MTYAKVGKFAKRAGMEKDKYDTAEVSESGLIDLLSGEKVAIDRPWSEYPIGTKANAYNGGHWIKQERGWKWCTGATFPTPGGDATSVTLPTT